MRTWVCQKRYEKMKLEFLPERKGGPLPELGQRLHYIKEMISNELVSEEKKGKKWRGEERRGEKKI